MVTGGILEWISSSVPAAKGGLERLRDSGLDESLHFRLLVVRQAADPSSGCVPSGRKWGVGPGNGHGITCANARFV